MAKPGKLPDFHKLYPEASEEVIAVLKETERKMQYQEYDLKAERTRIDQKTNREIVLPSREDSYERILEEGGQVALEQEDVETIVFTRLQHQKLYSAIMDLEEVEQYLIVQLFFLERTERSLAAELGISQRAVNKRRRKILDKLKNVLGNL